MEWVDADFDSGTGYHNTIRVLLLSFLPLFVAPLVSKSVNAPDFFLLDCGWHFPRSCEFSLDSYNLFSTWTGFAGNTDRR